MTSGQLSIIKTYEDNEIPITVTDISGKTIHYIIIRIGIINGLNILVLDNNKIYITENIKEVSYKEELNIHEIYSAITSLKDLESKIGDLLKLQTGNRSSIVNAINNINQHISNSRRTAGYIDYLAIDKKELASLEGVDDCAIGFVLTDSNFVYYSKAANEWLNLPAGWQMLPNIVRNKSQLSNKLTGVLFDSKVYNNYEPVHVVEYETVGNEYIVRNIIKENKSGILVYTPRGYVYTYSY